MVFSFIALPIYSLEKGIACRFEKVRIVSGNDQVKAVFKTVLCQCFVNPFFPTFVTSAILYTFNCSQYIVKSFYRLPAGSGVHIIEIIDLIDQRN